MNSLPDDCSPILLQTIKILNPLRSLSQLSSEYGFSYSEILKAA